VGTLLRREAPHDAALHAAVLSRGGDTRLGRPTGKWQQPASHVEPLASGPSRLLPQLEVEQAVQQAASEDMRPVSMREVLELVEPHKMAGFLQMEVPKRMAVRISMIESLHGWSQVPELVDLHTQLCEWFQKLRTAKRSPGGSLRGFTAQVHTIRRGGRRTLGLAAAGMHQLKSAGIYDDAFLDAFLDNYLLSRIGSNMLMDHYIACAKQEDGGYGKATGVIDPHCDATAICEQVAADVAQLCQDCMGSRPEYVVENYCAGSKGPQDSHCTFSFIPYYLRYILAELMKNSFRATVKNAANAIDLKARPVRVLVSRDEFRVAIRVSDRAGGIPFDVGDRIWSYLYGAAARSGEEDGDGAPAHAGTDLAGWGVGLPLSRLHARYLGGRLEVTSFPGFGTDAYVLLPRIEGDQVEEMPRQVLAGSGA